MVHEKNWRVSPCVQELCHPEDSLNSCSHSGISEHNGAGLAANNGSLRSIVDSSLFGFWFWVGMAALPGLAANNGSLRSIISSTFELDTGTGWESIPLRSSLSRVSLSLNTVVGGEVDKLEEDVGWSYVEVDKLEEELVDKPGTTIGTKFSVLHCIRIPF